MEDKQSVDEGTAWATIGTRSTTQNDTSEKEAVTDSADNSDPADSAQRNTTNAADAESANDKDPEGNGLEIDMDAPMEPIQIEAPESAENTSTENDKTQEGKKKNFIGDGFEKSGGQEKKKEPEKQRDRSRSRSRERTRYAETTNSSNPKKIRSRVFVGQVNMDQCSKEGLEEAFSKYGTVVCSNLQNGYAFVQFDSEESALLAIKGMNKTQLFGKEIAVCKPKAWIDLDKEEARMDSRSQRAMMEELEYLRRKDAERSRYPRGYDDHYRGYDRGYDRYEHDRYHYEMDRRGGDRYGYYGGGPPPPPPPRGPSYYGEDRYESRYRDPYYGGGGAAGAGGRSGMGGSGGGGTSGYYMGSGGGSGNSYYGRRM